MNERPGGSVASFRDLIAWQRAKMLCLTISALVEGFPDSQRWILTSQITRAALSTVSNVAEGTAYPLAGYVHYLTMARGSNAEVETQILIARDLGFGDPAKLDHAEQLCVEVGKLLNGLIAALRRKLPRP